MFIYILFQNIYGESSKTDIMRSRIVTIIAAASVASAVTPEGFEPASDTELFVQYGNQVVTPGAVLPQNG